MNTIKVKVRSFFDGSRVRGGTSAANAPAGRSTGTMNSNIFRYEALGHDEIRLLGFQREAGNNKISATLSFSLRHVKRPMMGKEHEPGSPPYRALSYTWGHGERNSPIHINGAEYKISEELHAALRHIHSDGTFESPLYLWVDAICINQLDNDEKSTQVLAMKQTYQDAKQVIVWLGDRAESRETTGRAARFLEELLPLFPDGGTPGFHPPGFQDALRDPEKSDIMYTIGRDVLRRAWWWRVWVIQEVAVAKSIAVLCDGHRFSWDHFVYLTGWFSLLKMDCMNPPEEDMAEGNHYFPNIRFKAGYRFNLVFAEDRETPMPILDLLQNASSCQATDNRDMIYALLGLATDITSVLAAPDGEAVDVTGQKKSIVVDYAKSVQEIYIDFATVHVQSHGEHPLDVITFSRYDLERMEGLPSWVPDWSNLRRSSLASFINPTISSPEKEALYPTYRYRASAGRRPSFSIADNTLRTSAIRFDKVTGLGDPYMEFGPPGWGLDHIISQWQRLALGAEFGPNSREHDPYPGGDATMLSVFDRTLSADSDLAGGRATPGQGYVFYRRSLQGFHFMGEHLEGVMAPGLAAAGRQHASQQLSDIARAIQLRIMGRRFFITSRGFFGLGQQNVDIGDVVFVVPGCSVPVILRPDGENWTFIGEAFVAGIMDGEAIQALDRDGEGDDPLRGVEAEVAIL